MYAPDIIVQTVFADSCWNIATDGTLPENLPYVEDGYMHYPSAKTSHEVFQRTIQKARLYSALVYFSWRLYATLSPGEEKSGTGEELYKNPIYSGIRFKKNGFGLKLKIIFIRQGTIKDILPDLFSLTEMCSRIFV